MKLVIGNKNYSSWSLRPWLLLTAHGIPFEEVRIPLKTEHTRASLMTWSDAGKVPVLHDDELVVHDSLAICEYVSERYLDGKGWPQDIRHRARARACSAEMHSGFAQLRESMTMNCRAEGRRVEITPALQADIDRIVQLWSGLRSEFADRGPWLFGDFSIADCMFAPVVFRFRTYGVEVPQSCSDYMAHALASDAMALWLKQCREEKETIPAYEVGLTPAHE